MSSHDEIAKKFATRKINSRQGRVSWIGSRVWCDDDLIFSYGRHFPMAKYLGEKNKKPFFIKNCDKYSSSTSAHQSCVREHCPGPSLSRSALAKYIGFIDFTRLSMDNIYLWRPGVWEHMWFDTKNNTYYSKAEYKVIGINDPYPADPWFSLEDKPDLNDPKKSFKLVHLNESIYVFPKENIIKLPKASHFKPYRKKHDADGQFLDGMCTITEVVILKVKDQFKDRYLLCTDGKVRELPEKPKTIASALKMDLQLV